MPELVGVKQHVSQCIEIKFQKKLFADLNIAFIMCCLHVQISIYLKSQDYGDVGAEAQQGRLTM